MLDDLLYD